MLKHNVDINAVDKVYKFQLFIWENKNYEVVDLNYSDFRFQDGLTVLHKAIGKKQAITNYLLRNSANPFVRDKVSKKLLNCFRCKCEPLLPKFFLFCVFPSTVERNCHSYCPILI